MADAQVIIIGSGFGGAVTACRLAQAGVKVIVLERGQEWGPNSFPRKPTDAWVFDPGDPAARHGWFDIRMFPHMTVITGAGIGGGSLVYANISVEAKRDTFDEGWPAEVTYDMLAPFYAQVADTMEITPVPQPQWPERTKLLKDSANAAGWGDRFRPLGLAVRFDDKWSYRSARSAQPGEVENRRQQARRRAGYVRPPRAVRHRLPGQGAEHARLQLPGARGEGRRLNSTAASGPRHQGRRGRV